MAEPDLRGTILAAAETVFSQVGLYDGRVDDVARQAGVAKGTIYLYFASKEELIRAVAEAALHDLSARCRHAAVDLTAPENRLRAVVDAHLAFFAERPDRMRILHQVRGMLKFARPEWRTLRSALEAHLEALADLLGAGRGAAAEWRDVACFLFGATSGCASVWAATCGATEHRSTPPRTFAVALAEAARVVARAERPAQRQRRGAKAGRAG